VISVNAKDMEIPRKRMVEYQIRRRGIQNNRVLSAMSRIPRERFVPEASANQAYDDHAIPIGLDQTISQPFIVATMTERLNPCDDETLLEVGTGSGYQTAILAQLSKFVYSIERIPELAERAKTTLSSLGIKNVEISVGDGTLGLDEHAPFDGILVAAASPDVPKSLKKQIAIGGRLVIPIGSMYSQKLVLMTRTEHGFEREEGCPCRFVPLKGEEGW